MTIDYHPKPSAGHEPRRPWRDIVAFRLKVGDTVIDPAGVWPDHVIRELRRRPGQLSPGAGPGIVEYWADGAHARYSWDAIVRICER